MLELKLDTEEDDEDVFLRSVSRLFSETGGFTPDRLLRLFAGRPSVRFPKKLELREESLMSEATLAESE